MRLRKIVQDYFTFSKKERNGIIVLLLVVILFAVASRAVFLFEKPDTLGAENFLEKIAEFEQRQDLVEPRRSLFLFDPNTIDSLALDSLSVPVSVKRNLLKFRTKGGRFFQPEDARKIYGMNDSVFSEIEKYIHIETTEKIREKKNHGRVQKKPEIVWCKFDPDTCTENDWLDFGLTPKQSQAIERYRNAIGGFKTKEQFAKMYGIGEGLKDSLLKYAEIKTPILQEVARPKVRQAVRAQIELNSADTVVLESLPGIGRVLSRRIIKYRELLGGFYSASQLLEVYGLSQECFQKIEPLLTIDTLKIKKLNINFSSAGELSAHPYIGEKSGREIVRFRSKNGLIINLTALINEKLLGRQQFEKMRPYLATKTP
ncbi:MAG: helix-hairpin-helix domain-containing protein [Prolixibacteraceae bacterium]|jgi:DNA uptake protein ComE-like DNA-binding protein|nr:helix-hairpin-helix domain-containing protein [Prolixibacteraceae bacterium]